MVDQVQFDVAEITLLGRTVSVGQGLYVHVCVTDESGIAIWHDEARPKAESWIRIVNLHLV